MDPGRQRGRPGADELLSMENESLAIEERGLPSCVLVAVSASSVHTTYPLRTVRKREEIGYLVSQDGQ